MTRQQLTPSVASHTNRRIIVLKRSISIAKATSLNKPLKRRLLRTTTLRNIALESYNVISIHLIVFCCFDLYIMSVPIQSIFRTTRLCPRGGYRTQDFTIPVKHLSFHILELMKFSALDSPDFYFSHLTKTP